MTLSEKTTWLIPLVSGPLRSNDVHVWLADLEPSRWDIPRLLKTLCETERHRANRLRFSSDRLTWALSRGLLRRILAGYVETEPDRLQFAVSRDGKPELVVASGVSLQFSLSHSGQYCVYALTREAEVGIDLEEIRPNIDADAIAAKFFTDAESSYLCNLTLDQKVHCFYGLWVCKEACAKASGQGLAVHPKSFHCDVLIGHGHGLVRLGSKTLACHRLPRIEGYAGAVAVQSKTPLFHFYAIPPDM